MGVIHRPRHTDTVWLAKGPIGPYVVASKQYLTERRYAVNAFASYVVGITHFARWARTKRWRLDRIDEVSIAEFLDKHLPSCQCAAQSPGLAYAISSDAITMRRLRWPRSRAAIGANAIRAQPSAHSCNLNIETESGLSTLPSYQMQQTMNAERSHRRTEAQSEIERFQRVSNTSRLTGLAQFRNGRGRFSH